MIYCNCKMKIVLFYLLLISGGVSAEDRKPLRCKNPAGKLWSSILNKNCGQSVCKKSGSKESWTQCPKAATEGKIEEENENLKKIIEKKIEESLNSTKKEMANMADDIKGKLQNILDLLKNHTTEPTDNLIRGVIISGGWNGKSVSSTDVFFPSSSGAGYTCSLQSMPSPRSGHTLDQLDDGTVLACGGSSSADTRKTCDRFDGTSWSQHSTLQYNRAYHTSLPGQHGLLLMGGDYSRATTELVGGDEQYNLQQNTYYACGITEPGSGNTIILTGGYGGTYLNTVAKYGPNGFIGALPSLQIARYAHGCGVVFVTGKKVFVVAGGYGSGTLSSTELLYDGEDSWVTGQALPRTLFGPASVSLANSVLLIGGYSSGSYRREILSFNSSLAWSVVGTLQEEKYYA